MHEIVGYVCNFGDEICLKGWENVKPKKNAIFLKKCKMVIYR